MAGSKYFLVSMKSRNITQLIARSVLGSNQWPPD